MNEPKSDGNERFRREQFIAAANDEYRTLGPDAEQSTWDGTLADGFDPTERPTGASLIG